MSWQGWGASFQRWVCAEITLAFVPGPGCSRRAVAGQRWKPSSQLWALPVCFFFPKRVKCAQEWEPVCVQLASRMASLHKQQNRAGAAAPRGVTASSLPLCRTLTCFPKACSKVTEYLCPPRFVPAPVPAVLSPSLAVLPTPWSSVFLQEAAGFLLTLGFFSYALRSVFFFFFKRENQNKTGRRRSQPPQ